MSWIANDKLNLLQKFCVNVLKCGPFPRHIAFIMDGNRRYAKKIKVKRDEGHTMGFSKLTETMQWCLQMGIVEVTVYAFSIENFKRSKDEVDTLMELAREKYHAVIDEKDQLMEAGICIRVIGNLTYLPPDLQKSVAEAMLLTKDNNKAFLNIAFSYTSTDEITTAINAISDGVNSGLLEPDDIDERLLNDCLYTNKSTDPDILIRTSGEVRFSDFLTWQSGYSHIWFAKVLWPELTVWHLLAAIFTYQRFCMEHKKLGAKGDVSRHFRVEKFLEALDKKRTDTLEHYSNMEIVLRS